MPITASSTFGLVQGFYWFKDSLLVACYHHLCNALALVDYKISVGKIDQQHHNLSTIVSIDSSRRVEHSDAMLQRQPTTRTYLRLVALW